MVEFQLHGDGASRRFGYARYYAVESPERPGAASRVDDIPKIDTGKPRRARFAGYSPNAETT